MDQRLIALLEEALSALGAEDGALRVHVLSRLAIALSFSVSSDRKGALSQHAVEMARRVGDPATLIYALSARHFVLWEPEHEEERLALTTKIIHLAEEAGDRERVLWGQNYRIANLLERGESGAAGAELAAFTQLAVELRHPRYLWVAAELRALWALWQGQFADVEPLSQHAFALGRHVGGQIAVQMFGAKLLLLRWEQDRLQELEDNVKRLSAQFAAQPVWRSALAWFYSELRRETEARNEFTALAASDFTDLPRDISWLLSLAFLPRVCLFLADRSRAATLYTLLLPYAGHSVVVPGAIFFYGCVSHSLGLLATLLSRWEDAERHFTDALAMYTKMGAKPWLAHTQHDYARMLLARNQPGDSEKAQRLLEQALATAQELGMTNLQSKVQGLKSKGQSLQTSSQYSVVSSQHAEEAEPTSKTSDFGPRTSDSEPQASSSLTSDFGPRTSDSEPQASSSLTSDFGPRTPDCIFRRDGEYWTLAYQGQVCRLKDAKGLRYIATLLRHPGQEFHVIDLAALTDLQPEKPTTRPRSSVEDVPAARRSGARPTDTGAVLDPQARAAYRQRLAELRDELAEAEHFHDSQRRAKAQAELDFLSSELAVAYGLGGRARKGTNPGESVRKAVTNNMRNSLAKIRTAHPVLWRHLFAALKTGTFCSYNPEQPIVWEV
jgi:tetratricopeptide (TPR) repeat protein